MSGERDQARSNEQLPASTKEVFDCSAPDKEKEKVVQVVNMHHSFSNVQFR